MYALAEHDLGALGYRHYEISNWAAEGKLGLHNIVYWRNEPYLGVGPGAHSSLAKSPLLQPQAAERVRQ